MVAVFRNFRIMGENSASCQTLTRLHHCDCGSFVPAACQHRKVSRSKGVDHGFLVVGDCPTGCYQPSFVLSPFPVDSALAVSALLQTLLDAKDVLASSVSTVEQILLHAAVKSDGGGPW